MTERKPMSGNERLYPLKFKPILKERLWGGSKLGNILDKPLDSQTTGESWELSGVAGDVSIVANGIHEGMSLQELINLYPAELLGEEVVGRFGKEFPILIKFIDAAKDLSIQLHPNDELARQRHRSFGKTEMWYIMDADDNSDLIIGFNRDVSKEEYRQSLENNKLESLLNYETVREGDTFFINTGKVHAIGAGILLAEIQQTSDITYRIFDFNRRDKEGNLRELHTDLAFDAIDYDKKNDYKVNYDNSANQLNEMVKSPYFTTKYLRLTENHGLDLSQRPSFSIYVCVRGRAKILADSSSVEIKKGETVLIPANTAKMDIITTSVTLLQVTI